MDEKYRIFGNRVLVSIISPTKPPERDLSHMPMPPGVAMAVPVDYRESWSSPFGKGQVLAIGESTNLSSVAPVAFSEEIIDAEFSDDGPPKEGFDKFAAQLIDMYKNSGLFSGSQTPMPPLSIGDVIVFRLYDASVLPDDQNLFVVEGSGIVAVVNQEDFKAVAA